MATLRSGVKSGYGIFLSNVVATERHASSFEMPYNKVVMSFSYYKDEKGILSHDFLKALLMMSSTGKVFYHDPIRIP